MKGIVTSSGSILTRPGRARNVSAMSTPLRVAPIEVPSEAASPRALQELAETVQRSRLGGPFYVLAWILAGLAADLHHTRLWVYIAGIVIFAGMGMARLGIRSLAAGASVSAVRRALNRIWGIVLVNSALWGVAVTGLLLTSQQDGSRLVSTVCSFAFATAVAHTFCMQQNRALLSIALFYLPTLGACIASGAGTEFVGIGVVYGIYVVSVLRRSYHEYVQRLDLEDELRDQRDLFEQQSQRDGLTGLANRRRFSVLLEELVRVAIGRAQPFALMMLDLDHFKSINDRHGHSVGDACLREFSARLQRAFNGKNELVARLGGEEFAVLIDGTDEDEAAERGEAFRQHIAGSPLALPELAIGITVSIGIGAFGPRHHADGDAFFNAVDQALYHAKATGRNAVCRVAALRE